MGPDHRTAVGTLALASVLTCAALAGCGDGDTELVLVIDSDLAAPCEIDEVHVVAIGSRPRSPVDVRVAMTGARAPRFPLSLVLVPGEGVDQLALTIEGLRAGVPIVRREVRTSFVPRARNTIEVALARQCLGPVPCPSGDTCVAGRCEDAVLATQPWRGALPGPRDAAPSCPGDGGFTDGATVEGGLDGSPAEGGMDAGVVDGGSLDAGVDGGPPCAEPLGHSCNPIPIRAVPFADGQNTLEAPQDLWDLYNCATDKSEAGGEYVYRLEVTGRASYSFMVADDSNTDIDIHILREPSPNTCLARDDTTVQITLDPGTYYVVADTFVRTDGTVRSGPYTLNITSP